MDTTAEILSRGPAIEAALRQLSLKDVPLSAIMICTMSEPLSSSLPVIDTEILEESVTASEIFRHSALIYLFRVCHGDSVPLDSRTQESIDEAFRLLPRIPEYPPVVEGAYGSVLGPGSILGWSLTVMGSELPSTMEEEREYIRCRWAGIHGLGLKHSFKAAELLEVVLLETRTD